MELATDRLTADGATPAHWLYVLHGVFGAGRNWASVMRRLVREREDWGALLVDLRQHGASQGFAPPHTVAAAAADLSELEREGMPPANAVLGHSFGGKVALARAESVPSGLSQVWVVDSTPAVRPPAGSAWDMLQVVRSLPDRFADRDELISALEGRGIARPTAQWMATNLTSGPDGYRWRFDLSSIEELLRDFFDRDLWDVVERPPEGMEVHLVKAAESSVLSGEALERVRRAAGGPRMYLHEVSGGHWVNADNPDALVDLLVRYLPEG